MISKISLNNDKAKKELDKVKEIEKNVDREKLVYKTIKTFGRDIYEGKITLEKANEYQTDLLAQFIDFRANTKPKSQEKNKKKKLLLKTCIVFLRVEKKFLMLLKNKILLTKSRGAGILNPDHSKLKI